MDYSEEEEEEVVVVALSNSKNEALPSVVARWCLAILFPIIISFVGIVAVFVANFRLAAPISLPSQCKIVSSSVDIRWAKVCEVGLLNYKAKHVFYSLGTSRFRCRYDYYWASVFKVEYKDHSSGQIRLAASAVPNEALPLNCRPDFGAAWLTKDKFKVNKTYDCWYTSGISIVSFYHDGFFHCQSEDPSTAEMIRRYSILSMKIVGSWFSSRGRAKYWRWETVVRVVTGFSTSLITIGFIRTLQQNKSWLREIYLARMVREAVNNSGIRRACHLVAYFSFVGWLTIQYVKWLGLWRSS